MDDKVVDFAELLAQANESKPGRNPGQWTPAAVEAWRRVGGEMARLLDAAFTLQLKIGRKVTVDDEDKVRAKLAEMEAATAAVGARLIIRKTYTLLRLNFLRHTT
jgi:hypothetical protein